MYQVNISERVSGETSAWVSRYSENGYRGTLVDTVYSDGADRTHWCVFTGTKAECEAYATNPRAFEHMLNEPLEAQALDFFFALVKKNILPLTWLRDSIGAIVFENGLGQHQEHFDLAPVTRWAKDAIKPYQA